MSEFDPSPIEPLPDYVQNQLPQSPFDAVVTRIAASMTDSDARVTLESFIESQKAPAYNGSQEAEAPKPIEEYPMGTELLSRVKQQIVVELFSAIRREESESIALLIQNNLVTANTRSKTGQTPLLEAISTKIVHIVKELLDFGADPNAFGVVVRFVSSNLSCKPHLTGYSQYFKNQVTRTPLMFAATTGSLPIVKLLFEPPYSANDALVAPDGQIALRLASAAGHRTIVDYLPSLRAGGYLRWKTQNALAIARMKAALRKIGTFIKFFVWSLPKHLVVLPVVRCCKYCWANRKKIGGWCKHQITEMPKRVVRAGKWVWKGVKKITKAIKETGKELWKFGTQTLPRWIKKLPFWIWDLLTVHILKAIKETGKALWKFGTQTLPTWIKKLALWIWDLLTVRIPKAIKETGKALWKFGTQTLPRWIKELALWFWDILTVRIPKAIVISAKWIWSGISSIGKAAWDVILKTVSFLHTVLQAIVTLLRNLTLRDIWNGFCDLLQAIFVTFPATLSSWIRRFGVASFEVMKALFGWFGELLWDIADVLQWLVLYIPSKLWIILKSLGGSIGRGFCEFMVWIHPKL